MSGANGNGSSPRELPDGWEWKRLVDLSRPKQWKTIKKSDLTASGYPVFGANGLIGFYSEYNHEHPTVLISCRGTCGKVHISPPKCYVTGNAMALDDLDTSLIKIDYLAHALVARGLDDVITGTAQPQITRKGLESVELPVPPMEVQELLVEAINTREEEISALETELDEVEKLQTQFRQALLRDAFSGRLTHDGGLPAPDAVDEEGRPALPTGWEWKKLSDVAENLDRERVPVNRKEREERIGDIPYYGATGQVGTIDDFLFDEPLVLLGEDGVQFLDPGVEKAYEISGKSWVNNHAHVLRPNLNQITNEFLCGALNTISYQGEVSGTTRLKLTQGKMNNLEVPCPTLTTQETVMREVKARLEEVAELNDYVDFLRRNLRNLKDSMLHQAFTGQLIK